MDLSYWHPLWRYANVFFCGLKNHRDDQVVLHIFANTWQVNNHIDPDCFEIFSGSDARAQQNSRRIQGTRSERNFSAVKLMDFAIFFKFNTHNRAVFDQETVNPSTRCDGQIGMIDERVQVRSVRALTLAIFEVELLLSDALLVIAVVVLVECKTPLLAGLEHSVLNGMLWIVSGNVKQTSDSAKR